MVDQVLVAGGTHVEVTEFNREDEDVVKNCLIIEEKGKSAGLFAYIVVWAIAIHREFLEILMNSAEKEPDIQETATRQVVEISEKEGKGARPDSRETELRFMKIEPIYQSLNKCNRKLYALRK